MLANKTRSGYNDRLDNMANHHSESTSRLNFERNAPSNHEDHEGDEACPFSLFIEKPANILTGRTKRGNPDRAGLRQSNMFKCGSMAYQAKQKSERETDGQR